MIVSFIVPDNTQGISIAYVSPTGSSLGITANVFVREELLLGVPLDASDGDAVPMQDDSVYTWIDQQEFDDAEYEVIETEDDESYGSTDVETPDGEGLDPVPEGNADDDIEGQRQGADDGVEEETTPGEALPDTDSAVLL